MNNSKKLEDFDIVEILNGYESEMDDLVSDDDVENELESQAENGIKILLYL